MANTLNLGTDGNWATKEDSLLAYNSENGNFKPLAFDFTRNGCCATVVNKDGLIETVGGDIPRIDFSNDAKGALLLEPTRSNNLLQSNQFDTTWINSGTSVTSGYLGLDGTNSAWLLTKGANGFENTRQNITFSGIHTFSVYLKKGTNTTAVLRSTGGLDAKVEINLIDGTTSGEVNTTSVKTESMGNDWWRCSITFNASSNTAVRIYPEAPLGGTTAGNIYIQYAQLEQGSYATSYIPNFGNSAGATRSADVCNNGGNEQVINSTEGVLYAEISGLTDIGTNQSIAISDGSISNRILLRYNSTNQIRVIVISGGDFVFDKLLNISSIEEYNKFAIKYKQNDFALWVNGFELKIGDSGVTPTGLNELALDDGSGINDFYGNVKDLRVYNTALSDSELAALTK
jgi:hypothetical protein